VLAEGQVIPAYIDNDIYRPLTYKVNADQPWLPELFLLGQLRPGVSRKQAEAALAGTKPAVPTTMQEYLSKDRPVLSSMTEVNQTFRVELYWVMLGAVGFLYAIACLNASNLMLVRMLGQRRELSIRLALGGGRWRIIRLLTLESVTLAVLGSLTGLLVANWFFPLLLNVAGSTTLEPSWTSWTLDWRAVGVMGLLAVTTSLFIGLVPATRILRTDIYSGLKDGGAALGESPALARLRSTFVIFQAAFAVILLAGAGLMIQTFQNLRKVDLGFDPAGRAKVRVSFPMDYPAGTEVRLTRLREIQVELRRIPGVRNAAFGDDALLSGFYFGTNEIEGADGKPLRVATLKLSLGYQDAAGLRLKAGRWPDQSNGNEVMVNEAFARARWPGQNAVGQLLRPAAGATADKKGWHVIGVVGDVRSSFRDAAGLCVYGPEGWWPLSMNTFIVSLAHEYDEGLGGRIRQALYKFDSRIVVAQIASLTDLRENQLWAEKLADSVLKVLAGIALLLTVVGIFSVLAYTVDRRMGEFGVRLALGATSRDLIQLVMRRGVLLSLTGIVLGLGGATALTRYLQSLLFETSAQDPKVFGAVGVVLLLTSVLACVLPARRATKVDITRLLRSE
jgi:putative ABC transport system permease protein